MAKKGELQPDWFVIDANNLILGRLASFVAKRLRGKHRPEFTPHQLCGDAIIIVNAEKIKVTGNKLQDKIYHRHTGYRLKSRSLQEVLDKHPERVLEKAIKGMLPKCALGRCMYSRLKVYAGASHPHMGQNPDSLTVS
jgi:large subunit ribosomal protein L13